MKNRIKAIILATGLTVSMLCGSVSATEAGTEAAATEAVTEASTEAAATEAAEAAASEVAEADEAASEAAADSTGTDAAAGGTYAQYYDSMKTSVASTLEALAQMTDEQLDTYINSDSAVEAAMAANWSNVKEELGNYVEVTSQNVTEDGSVITVDNEVKYDGVADSTKVNVVYTYDVSANTATLDWNIDYPMSSLMEKAALNTVMGIGIVFLMLLFLSLVISQLHWIPDLLGRKEKEKQAALAATPAPAPVAAPVVEEDLTDDMELVAVISAAIAASENTSTDGFVVRSIKKANRKKWQNA